MKPAIMPVALIGCACLVFLTACGTNRSVVIGDFSAREDDGNGFTAEIAYDKLGEHTAERVVVGSSVVEEGALELKFQFKEDVPRIGTFMLSNPDRSYQSGSGILLEKGAQYTIEVLDPTDYYLHIESNGVYGHLFNLQDKEEEHAIRKLRQELIELRRRMRQADGNGASTRPPFQDNGSNQNTPREPSVHATVLEWENMACVDYAGEFQTFRDRLAYFRELNVESDEVRKLEKQLRESWDRKFERRNQRLIEILSSSTDPVERLLALEYGVDLELEEAVGILEELETQLPEQLVEDRVIPRLSWMRDEMRRQEVDESLKLGTFVPTFELSLGDSKSVSLATVLQKSQVVVLEFWENYCGRCISALTQYQTFYADFAKLGFEVVSVSIEHERDAWVQKSEELDFPWFNAFAPGGAEGEIAGMFGLDWPRRNFVLDSEGCILKRDLTPDELRDFLGARLGS